MATTSHAFVKNYTKGRNIVHQSPGDRNSKKNEFLKGWVLEYAPFFRMMSQEDLELVLENMSLETYKAREVVFQQEDYNQNFYVVLRGTLAALVDTSSLQRMFYTFNTEGDKKAIRVQNGLPLSHLRSLAKKEKTTTLRHTHSVEMWRMTKGDHFGQEALILRDGKALYSVRCLEHTELLVVDGSDFDETLKPYFHKIFFDRTKLLYGMGIFHNCSPMSVRFLSLLLRETKHFFGECLYRQKMHCNSIRIIGEGAVKISSDYSQKPPLELMDKIRPPKDHLSEILMEDKPKGTSKITTRRGGRGISNGRQSAAISASTVQSKLSSLTVRSTLTARTSQNKKKKVDRIDRNNLEIMGFVLHQPSTQLPNTYICTLGQGDMLGDIECSTKLTQHLFSAVCVSNTTIYEIKASLFAAVLHKRFGALAYQMVNRSMQKVEAWQLAHSSIQFFGPSGTVLTQIKGDLEEEGSHKHVRKPPKNETPESLALACINGLDLQIPETNSETTIPYQVPDITAFSEEESISSAILSQFEYPSSSSIETTETKNPGQRDSKSSRERATKMPSSESHIPIAEDPVNLEADLTYYPPLNETRAMKERKKRLYSFDVAVPFGKSTCSTNKLVSVPNQSAPTQVGCEEVNKSGIKFENGLCTEEGSKYGNGCAQQTETCAKSSLAKVRYDVMYNKGQLLKRSDSFNIITTEEFVRKGLIRPLHKLVPDLPQASIAKSMAGTGQDQPQASERNKSSASVLSIDDKFEPLKEIAQVRHTQDVRGDCMTDQTVQKQSSLGSMNVLQLEIGTFRKSLSPELSLSAAKRKRMESGETPTVAPSKDAMFSTHVPHPWIIMPPKSAPDGFRNTSTARLMQQEDASPRPIYFRNSKSCNNMIIPLPRTRAPNDTPLLSPRQSSLLGSNARNSAHFNLSNKVEEHSYIDIPL